MFKSQTRVVSIQVNTNYACGNERRYRAPNRYLSDTDEYQTFSWS